MTDRASRALRRSTGYCLAQNEVTGRALRMAQRNLRIATAKNDTLNNEDVDSSQPKQVQSKRKRKTVTRDTLQSIGKTSRRNSHTVRGATSTVKESNVETAENDNITTDNQVGINEQNDDDTNVSSINGNNILEHSDKSSTCTGTLIDQNNIDLNSISDLPNLSVPSIINDTNETKNTENSNDNALLPQRDAKITALKKITAPTQTIHVSHSTTGFPCDDSTVTDDQSSILDEVSLGSFNINDDVNDILNAIPDDNSKKTHSSCSTKIDLIDDIIRAFNLPKPTKSNLPSLRE